MKSTQVSSQKIALALGCLFGAANLHAEQYTTLQPIGTTERPQYITTQKQPTPSNVDLFNDVAEKSPFLGPGLVGRNYISATYDYIHNNENLGVYAEVAQWEPFPGMASDILDANTNGATVRANFSVTQWLDFGLQYSYQKADWNGAIIDSFGDPMFSSQGDSSKNNFWMDFTFHYPVSIDGKWTVKPYARAAIGITYEEFSYTAVDSVTDPLTPIDYASDGNNTEGMYGAEIGVELPIGDRFCLTPFVGWQAYFDSDYCDSTFYYGGRANLYFGYGFGVMVSVAGSNNSNVAASVGATFSF